MNYMSVTLSRLLLVSVLCFSSILLHAQSCGSPISDFPYNVDFESGLSGWTQGANGVDDDIDWTVDADGTPSSGTGPDDAYQGNNYIYTEASGSNFPEKEAFLTSPCFEIHSTSLPSVEFVYHMQGTGAGELNLEVSIGGSNTWTTIWSRSGNQSVDWINESVNLSAYKGDDIQLRFRGVTGPSSGGWQSDIALDHITVYGGPAASADNCGTRIQDGLIAFYNFQAGAGNVVYDVSGVGIPMHLSTDAISGYEWVADGGLRSTGSVFFSYDRQAKKLYDAVTTSNSFSVEAWVTPDNETQSGPARIATYSENTTNRNFTLGQEDEEYHSRVRTSDGSNTNNGTPALESVDIIKANERQHVVYTFNATSNTEQIYVNGVLISSEVRLGLLSNWNPEYVFGLFNEVTVDRPWNGLLHSLALYDKELSSAEIQTNIQEGAVCLNLLQFSPMTCGDYADVDIICTGLEDDVPSTITIPDTTGLDSVKVEIIYKGSHPGATISVQDDQNNSYSATRVDLVSNARLYSFDLPATSTVTYANTINDYDAQSMCVYTFTSGQQGKQYVTRYTEISSLPNSTEWLFFDLPYREQAQDISLILPISEVTYDNRSLTITARSGQVSKTISRTWGASGAGFPDGCCVDTLHITLPDVPANTTHFSLEIESPSSTGQSYVLAGLVAIEIDCGEDEVCDDGIDNDFDGLTDCEDPDCDAVVAFTVDVGPDMSQCYNAGFSLNADIVGCPDYGMWTVESGNAILNENIWWHEIGAVVAPGQSAVLRYTAFKGATTVYDELTISNTTNCSDECIEPLNQNGDIEDEGTATNFNLMLESTPALLIEADVNPTSWEERYGGTATDITQFNGAFYFKKTGAQSDPYSGTHAIYLKGDGKCLSAMTVGSDLPCGSSYRFSVQIAAYSYNATQGDAEFALEFSAGGDAETLYPFARLTAPASNSWNDLNWNRYYFDVDIPDNGYYYGDFYFTSKDDTHGIVVDDVCITQLSEGATASAGADQSGCDNVFQLTANPASPGFTGAWTVTAGNVSVSPPNSESATATINSGNVASLEWTVTDGDGCMDTDELLLSYTPLSDITVNNEDICVGESVTLTATGCTESILWSTGDTTQSINVSPTSTTDYTATCYFKPSDNLLHNPGFENAGALTHWQNWGSSSIVTNAVDVYSGSQAMMADATSVSWAGFGQNLLAVPGEYFEFTAFAKATNVSKYPYLSLAFLDGSWETIGEENLQLVNSVDYQQYLISGLAPPGTVRVQVSAGVSGPNAQIFVDGAELIRKNNCYKEAIATVSVTPQPAAVFTVDSICVNTSLVIEAASQVTGTTYDWALQSATPASATGQSVSAVWSTTGVYDVELTVSNGDCSDSSLQQVIVQSADGGTITGDEISCTAYSGSTLRSYADPVVSDGNYTLQWQQSTDGLVWSDIVGATGLEYTPGVVSTTTHYRRTVLHGLCQNVYSNTIIKTVDGTLPICPEAEEFAFPCQTGYSISPAGRGINGIVDPFLRVLNATFFDYYIVEATFSGGVGAPESVIFTNEDGEERVVNLQYYEGESGTAGARYFKTILPATDTVFVEYIGDENLAESLTVYPVGQGFGTSDRENFGQSVHKVLAPGEVHKVSFPLATTTDEKDIYTSFNFSSLADNGTELYVKIYADGGSLTDTLTTPTHGNSLGLAFMNIEDLAPSADSLHIEITSPVANGQTAYLSGYITALALCDNHLVITAESDADCVAVGDTITYDYTLYNFANVQFTNVNATSSLGGDIDFGASVIPGDTTFTATQAIIITQEMIDNPPIVNDVFVAGWNFSAFGIKPKSDDFKDTLTICEICDDGIDNDNDGMTDCLDPDCYEGVFNAAQISVSTAEGCEGDTVQLTVLEAGYQYQWSANANAATTQSISVILPMVASSESPYVSYAVTVTSDSGCTAEATATVQVHNAPVVTPSIDTICAGESIYIVPSAVASGSSSPLTYQWSTGQTADSIVVSPAITTDYLVTVTDSEGCTAATAYTVVVRDAPQVTLQSTAYNGCLGDTVTISVSESYPSYQWGAAAGNATSQSVEVYLDPNSNQPFINYEVTVTNEEGCTKTESINIFIYAPPVVSVSQNDTICAGSSATLFAAGADTYLWSTGHTGSSITVLPSSNTIYTVVGTSIYGCVDSATVSVVVSPQLTSQLEYLGAECLTDSTQLQVVPTGGTSPYTYQWIGPAGLVGNTQSVPIDTNGHYYVTVTDAAGCESYNSGFIYQRYEPTILNLQTDICEGESVVLSVGGSNAANYQWSTNAGSSTDPSVVVFPSAPSSSYQVTVTNSQGCTAVAEANIAVNARPTTDLNGGENLCLGEAVQLSPSTGGNWSSNNAGIAIVNSDGLLIANGPGTTTVQFTDAVTGCTSDPALVSVTIKPTLSTSDDVGACSGEQVVLSATSSGIAPISYSWNNGASLSDTMLVTATTFNNEQSVTNYFVTVTDGNGCTADEEVAVTAYSQPIATFVKQNTLCDASNGSITFLFDNFVERSTIRLSINDGANWTEVSDLLGSYTFSNLPAGDYQLLTSWSNEDCEYNVADISIGLDSNPSAIVSVDNGSCGTADQGGFTFTFADASSRSMIEFSIDGGATYPYTVADNAGSYSISNLAIGSYDLWTRWGNNQCPVELGVFDIVSAAAPTAAIDGSTAVCNENTLLLAATGGDTYLWSTGEATAAIQVLPATTTTYQVTVTTEAGCQDVASHTVSVSPALTLMLDFNGSECLTDSSKIIAVHTGGVTPYTYAWEGPNSITANTKQIDVTTNGVYEVTVTDGSGCTATSSGYMYQQFDAFIINLQTEVCEGESVNLAASASGATSYQWSANASGAITPSVSVYPEAPSSTYTVTITNNNGCTAVATATVTAIESPDIEIDGPSALCVGESSTVTSNVNGIWLSSNTSVASVSFSGVVSAISAGTTYLSFVDGANGCTSTESLLLNVHSSPAPSFQGATVVCVGEQTQLSPATGGTWTSENPGVATVSNSGLVTSLNNGITKFTWVNSLTGCTATTTQSLLVNGKPSITIPVASPLCIDGTAQAFPSTGGVWVSENPTIASITNTGFIRGLSEGKAAFTFTNTSTGCVTTSSDSITILPQTDVSFDGPTSVCIGASTAVLPSTGGTWVSDNPLVATISNAGIISTLSVGTARFRFTNTATGCTSVFTEALTVNPTPQVSNQGSNTLCLGSVTQLVPSTGGVWTSTNPAVASVDAMGVVTAVASGTAAFSFTNATGCSASLSLPISVVSPPDIEVNGPDEVCVNSTVTLSPTSGGVWESSDNNIATVSALGVVTSIAAGSVTFTFTESSTGCQSAESLEVTVLEKPVATITGSSDLCIGGTSTLTPSAGGVWVSTNPSVATVTNAGLVTAVSSGVTRFSFVSDEGCSSNQTTPLVVYSDPIPVLVGDDISCIGTESNLLPNSGGTWVSSNPTVATVTDGGVVTAISIGTSTFTYTDTVTGCSSAASEILTVEGGPEVNISGVSNICIGQTTTVAPTVGGIWVSSDPTVATVDNAGTVVGVSSGTATFTYTNVASGCTSSPTDPITVSAGTDVSITGDTNICIGGTSYLTPMTGGLWTSTNSSVATVTNAGVITAVSQGVARFRFTNSTTGCKSELSAPITVSDGPPISFTGADDVCVGSTTTVSPSVGGAWTSSDPAVATVTNSGVVTAVTSGTAILSFVDATTGCSGQGTLLVTVAAPTTVSVTGAVDICIGGHTQLSPVTGGVWTSSNPKIATVSSSGIVTGIAPGSVSFSFTDATSGCTLGSETEPISVTSCAVHDFNVTSPGLSISSSVMTNDNVPLGTTYGNNISTLAKPQGSLPLLTMQADGSYTFMATIPGKYQYSIPVCMPPAALGCFRTLLEITVLGNLFSEYNVVSNLEQGGTYASASSMATGTPVTIAAAANDQCVNAPGCDLDNATYTITSAPNYGLAVIDGNGNIIYTPGAGHIGHDTITYQVCADGDPSACATARQFITVAHTTATNSISASDDFSWGMKDLPISGTVMDNDGDAEGHTILVSAAGTEANPIAVTGGAYAIDTDGSYTFWPEEGYTGYAEIVYTVCDDSAADQACTDATLHLLVFDDLTVPLKVYLEGALMSNRNENAADGSPLMRDDLRVNPFDGKNYIPTIDPYTFAPGILDFTAKFPKVGPALLAENQVISDSAAVFSVTGQDAIVDWVFVEIRDKSNPTTILGSRAGLVQRDGDVVDLDGVSDLRFKGVNADSFYIVVNHRSHLAAMSLLVGNGEVVDFRSLEEPLYDFGIHAQTGLDYTGLATNNYIKSGYRALWAGDFDANGVVKYENPTDDHNILFFGVLTLLGNELGTSNFDFGYTYADCDYNMNGKAKYDNPNDDKNMLFYQIIAYPLNGDALSNFSSIIEQVPR